MNRIIVISAFQDLGPSDLCGIKGNILDWVAAMLSHRSQRVRVNNSFSSWQEVTSGIPQGSVIGPLLFVIFINDLPEVIKSSELFLFADDMKLFHAIYTEEDCTSLQQDLILAKHWTNTSLLKCHPNKCSHTRIGLSNITLRHMSEKINKANSLMGIIRRTFNHMDEQCFSTIFIYLRLFICIVLLLNKR